MTPPPVSALDVWRQEVAKGIAGQSASKPDSWRLDALWRAACLEARAEELDALGLDDAAERDRDQAAEIILAEGEPLEAA